MTETTILDEGAVAEIEARANAATGGPWSKYHRVSPRGAYKHWHIGNKDGLCQITMHGYERDYDFMAHAREDIPALCATVKNLREQLQEEQNRNQLQADSIMGCEAEITSLQSQLEQLHLDLNSTRSSYQELEEAYSNRVTGLEQLRAERDELRQRLLEARETKVEL